jgi:hypothetical protein
MNVACSWLLLSTVTPLTAIPPAPTVTVSPARSGPTAEAPPRARSGGQGDRLVDARRDLAGPARALPAGAEGDRTAPDDGDRQGGARRAGWLLAREGDRALHPWREAPGHFEVRYVSRNGGIRWNRRWVCVSHLLMEQYVGLEAIDEGLWNVYCRPIWLGWFVEAKHRILDRNDCGLRRP